jgi:Opioid growth factor receptor (OGFr) conserved region.
MDYAQPLVAFYRNLQSDDRGRMLDDILARDDDWLESTHDYIQWLFPLAAPSGANPFAPVLDEAQIAVFRQDAALQEKLLQAFGRMLAFYGLERQGDAIAKGPNWSRRKVNWFTRPTHNNLRITRILASLRLLGLESEARAFYRALIGLTESEADVGVGEEALIYWGRAVVLS